MKSFKRGAVAAAVLIFVAAAVYLNWSYGKNEAAAQETYSGDEAMEQLSQPSEQTRETTDAPEESAGLYYETAQESEAGEFFSTARLSRNQARDEAKSALSAICETPGASQEAIDSAIAQMTAIASNAVLESEIETLICAKGFSECVTYISDSGVTVTVAPVSIEGLSAADAARITDIVTEKTGFTAQELNIVEIK